MGLFQESLNINERLTRIKLQNFNFKNIFVSRFYKIGLRIKKPVFAIYKIINIDNPSFVLLIRNSKYFFLEFYG